MTFQPGNPGGGKRKEKLGFDSLMMEMKAAEDMRGMRVIARKLLDLAVSGDMQAIKEVFNRIDGMPIATVEATTEHVYVARIPEPSQTTQEWLNSIKSSGNHSQARKPN